MSKLTELRAKLSRRLDSLKHHSQKHERFKKNGRKVRAAYQAKRIEWDKKAIEKLKKLVHAEAQRIESQRVDWSGHPPLSGNVKDCARTALNAHPDLYITATTDGTHSPGSYHYQRKAFDAGSSGVYGEAPEIAAQEALARKYGYAHFMELFGPAGWYVKNGTRYEGIFPNHGDHLHAAPYSS